MQGPGRAAHILADGAVKHLSCVRQAAKRIAIPKTSKALPIIDPVMVAFTSGYISGPCERISRAMMSSAALPKVAFKSRRCLHPTSGQGFPVTSRHSPASGITASPDTRNFQRGLT